MNIAEAIINFRPGGRAAPPALTEAPDDSELKVSPTGDSLHADTTP